MIVTNVDSSLALASMNHTRCGSSSSIPNFCITLYCEIIHDHDVCMYVYIFIRMVDEKPCKNEAKTTHNWLHKYDYAFMHAKYTQASQWSVHKNILWLWIVCDQFRIRHILHTHSHKMMRAEKDYYQLFL